jgi:hypothetical protein
MHLAKRGPSTSVSGLLPFSPGPVPSCEVAAVWEKLADLAIELAVWLLTALLVYGAILALSYAVYWVVDLVLNTGISAVW